MGGSQMTTNHQESTNDNSDNETKRSKTDIEGLVYSNYYSL